MRQRSPKLILSQEAAGIHGTVKGGRQSRRNRTGKRVCIALKGMYIAERGRALRW